MASRLLRVGAALRLLPAATSRAAPARHFAAPGDLATDEEQATGLERKLGMGLPLTPPSPPPRTPTVCSGRSATRAPRRTPT
uniref:Uncharacterized protein n=1 Tax=Pavo cristatus TaxID=9049 RepID=A0A8C9G045_PAVCR